VTDARIADLAGREENLNKELALLHQLPVTPEHLRQELRLQFALGVSLMVTRGVSAPEPRRRVLNIISRLEKDHWLERNLKMYGDTTAPWFDAATFLNWFAHTFQPENYLEVGVRRPDGSTAPAPELPGPTFLKWAREPDFGPRDVEVDRPRPLDLCFALASTPAQLRFFAPPSPSGVLIFPPGVYRVKVEVTADDMRPALGVFGIDFTQGWDRIVVGQAA